MRPRKSSAWQPSAQPAAGLYKHPSPTARSLLTMGSWRSGTRGLQPSQSQPRASSTVTATKPCPVPYPHVLHCSRTRRLKPQGLKPAAPPRHRGCTQGTAKQPHHLHHSCTPHCLGLPGSCDLLGLPVPHSLSPEGNLPPLPHTPAATCSTSRGVSAPTEGRAVGSLQPFTEMLWPLKSISPTCP